jgi:hypothetical protein
MQLQKMKEFRADLLKSVILLEIRIWRNLAKFDRHRIEVSSRCLILKAIGSPSRTQVITAFGEFEPVAAIRLANWRVDEDAEPQSK